MTVAAAVIILLTQGIKISTEELLVLLDELEEEELDEEELDEEELDEEELEDEELDAWPPPTR